MRGRYRQGGRESGVAIRRGSGCSTEFVSVPTLQSFTPLLAGVVCSLDTLHHYYNPTTVSDPTLLSSAICYIVHIK